MDTFWSYWRPFGSESYTKEVEISCLLERHDQERIIFVMKCEVCQKCKYDISAYLGLLQSLPIPERIGQHTTMDFIKGLPNSKSKEVIYMVVIYQRWLKLQLAQRSKSHDVFHVPQIKRHIGKAIVASSLLTDSNSAVEAKNQRES